jgi:hypothetical protein
MHSSLLTVNLITREAVELFKNTNLFLKRLDSQYELINEIYVSSAPAIIGMKEGLILIAVAVLKDNPVITRRFWSGYNANS